MKEVKGIWFPDGEKHLTAFPEVVQDGTYQKKTLDLALEHVDRFRNAIDVGAHVGLWSMHLVKQFECVHAFEPVLEHIACFIKNVGGTHKMNMCSLGDEEKESFLWHDYNNSGHTHIDEKGGTSTTVKTLDSFNLTDIDFMKIDCEGYEVFVCKGAEEMLKREKPVICIEQKPFNYYGGDNMDGVKYLETLGYKIVGNIRKDFILKHD